LHSPPILVIIEQISDLPTLLFISIKTVIIGGSFWVVGYWISKPNSIEVDG